MLDYSLIAFRILIILVPLFILASVVMVIMKYNAFFIRLKSKLAKADTLYDDARKQVLTKTPKPVSQKKGLKLWIGDTVKREEADVVKGVHKLINEVKTVENMLKGFKRKYFYKRLHNEASDIEQQISNLERKKSK